MKKPNQSNVLWAAGLFGSRSSKISLSALDSFRVASVVDPDPADVIAVEGIIDELSSSESDAEYMRHHWERWNDE